MLVITVCFLECIIIITITIASMTIKYFFEKIKTNFQTNSN